MKHQKTYPERLLITRFPLESAWGGEEEVHLLMAKLFRENGKDTLLLTSSRPFVSAFRGAGFAIFSEFQKDITSKIRLFWSILSVPFFFLRGIFWLLYFRFFRRIRTVLFLTLIEKIAWTPLARIFGMKVFWGHHTPLGKWFFRNPWLFLWKLWSRLQIQIIVPSSSLKEQLRPLVSSPQKIRVIHNSENKKFVQSIGNPKKKLQELIVSKGFSIDISGKFLVGTANRLAPEKGMEDVIRAAEVLKNSHSPFLFLCAGEGPERKFLEQEIASKNLSEQILLLGFLTESCLELLLKEIDLFLLASHEEPFGIVLLEAMKLRKAIVATEVGGIPEVLGAGNPGLVPGRNPEKMAAKIRFFRDDADSREAVALKNFQNYQDNFSIEKFTVNIMHTFFDQNLNTKVIQKTK